MTIATLFFVFLALFVIAGLVAAFNFAKMAKGMFNSVSNGDAESAFKGMSSGFGIHIIVAVVGGLSGLGALITGIVWLVQYFKG
jgi:hypothetical protein